MLNIVLEDERCLPYVGSEEAAGIDLRMRIKTAAGFTPILPRQTIKFDVGIRVQIPKGWVGLILPRSGLGFKYRIQLDNTVGVIDSDYIGVIQVSMTNDGQQEVFIEDFERVCQMVVVPHLSTKFNIVDALTKTARGEKGFGSSGKQ